MKPLLLEDIVNDEGLVKFVFEALSINSVEPLLSALELDSEPHEIIRLIDIKIINSLIRIESSMKY